MSILRSVTYCVCSLYFGRKAVASLSLFASDCAARTYDIFRLLTLVTSWLLPLPFDLRLWQCFWPLNLIHFALTTYSYFALRIQSLCAHEAAF